jgi:dGTPase
MTHSLEVAQVARTIGRALRLNEDLIEAIALAHDLGHTPFGHAGEAALDAAIVAFHKSNPESEPRGPKHFRHYEQSLRIVDHLENLNLTEETRLGISGHSKGRKDLTAHDGEPTSTLEAAVVRVSDRIAYLAHDIDDALRSGIITALPSSFDDLGSNSSQRVGRMVIDVIDHSIDQPAIRMSSQLQASMNGLKEWMFENVYLHYPTVFPDIPKAQEIVSDLFEHFVKVGNLPPGYEGVQGAVDYVAGMTDRFAITAFTELRVPSTDSL